MIEYKRQIIFESAPSTNSFQMSVVVLKNTELKQHSYNTSISIIPAEGSRRGNIQPYFPQNFSVQYLNKNETNHNRGEKIKRENQVY